MSVYLGLDASTQSLTATLIDATNRRLIAEISLNYATELPQYGTDHGVIRGDDPKVVAAPPLMWIEALDLMMARLVAEHRDVMIRLAAVSGSAQQHGSVYLNDLWPAALAAARTDRSLVQQVTDVFSRDFSPVWMDSSTTRECEEIENGVGGERALARNTDRGRLNDSPGRRFARSRSMIRRVRADDANSSGLVVSASLHAGMDAPVDPATAPA